MRSYSVFINWCSSRKLICLPALAGRHCFTQCVFFSGMVSAIYHWKRFRIMILNNCVNLPLEALVKCYIHMQRVYSKPRILKFECLEKKFNKISYLHLRRSKDVVEFYSETRSFKFELDKLWMAIYFSNPLKFQLLLVHPVWMGRSVDVRTLIDMVGCAVNFWRTGKVRSRGTDLKHPPLCHYPQCLSGTYNLPATAFWNCS